MAEKRYGRSVLIVDDMEAIPSYEIAGLEVGDCVVWESDGDKDGYIVTQKTEGGITFTLTLSNVICQFVYLFDEDTKEWVFEDYYEHTIPSESELGLELIEWDGSRDFTEEEVAKLLTGKVGVKLDQNEYFDVYLPAEMYLSTSYIILTSARVSDDPEESGLFGLVIFDDGTFETYDYYINDLKGTKLYRHQGTIDGEYFDIVCPIADPFNSSNVEPCYIGYSSSNEVLCFLQYEDDKFDLCGTNGIITSSATLTDTVTPL